MKTLFLYRTPKKKRYFSALKKEALKGTSTKVIGYYSLIYNFGFLKPLNKSLKQAQEKAVLETFKSRRLFGSSLLIIFYKMIISFKIKCLYKGLNKLLTTLEPEQIIVWNGLKHTDLVLKEALKLHPKIELRFMENGFLPNSTFLDSKGINAGSSLSAKKSFYVEQNITDHLDFQDLKGRASIKNKSLKINQNLKEGYALLPFQMERDSQILDYSPWIENMNHLFKETQEALLASKLKNKTLVVREHPSTKIKYKNLYTKASESLVFDDQTDLNKALKDSSFVITINSSVGFEALLMNKKVIVLGEAFYALEGLCLKARNQDELIKAINSINHFEIDQKFKDHFISYLSNDFLVKGDWKKPTAMHFESFRKRLQSL